MNQFLAMLLKLATKPPGAAPANTTTTSATENTSAVRSQTEQRLRQIERDMNFAETGEVRIDGGGSRRAQKLAYQTLWIQELIRRLLSRRDPKMADILHSTIRGKSEDVMDETRRMMNTVGSILKSLTLEFNTLTLEIPGFEGLRLSVGDLRDVKEEDTSRPYGVVSKGATPKGPRIVSLMRFRVSTQSWCMSVRGSRGRIEMFLVPSSDLFVLFQSETPVRLRMVLTLDERLGMQIWTIDGLPVDLDELYNICRNQFRNMLFASAQNLKDDLDSGAFLQNLEGDALKNTVRELLLAEQNMAQKIVSQQEDIQNRIARDLHDAVIADIMTLKRSVSGDAAMTNEQLSVALDSICQRIREICHDLTPRDLRDWGLQTVIEDLLERVAQRIGADCSFECGGELPEFPYPVQLHLFRIVQECLNNIEKYADASRVIVKFEVSDQVVRLTMKDDGKGFEAGELDSRRAREGGTGLSGIKERAEMIRCFYPTKLRFESAPGKGSATILEMRLTEGTWQAGRD